MGSTATGGITGRRGTRGVVGYSKCASGKLLLESQAKAFDRGDDDLLLPGHCPRQLHRIATRENGTSARRFTIPACGEPIGGVSMSSPSISSTQSSAVRIPAEHICSKSSAVRRRRTGLAIMTAVARIGCESALRLERACRIPARVEGVAYCLACKDEQCQHGREREESGEHEPGRMDIGATLRKQAAERR